MIQTRLGKDGPLVSAIGQGTWGLGGRFSADRRDDDLSVDTIRMGLDLGLTFIDTAEAYGAGHTERLVGRAVQGRRSEAFIATKVSPEHLGARDVIEAAEGSLGRLATDFIDLYQIHWPNPAIPIEETLGAMEKLIEQGKARFIGLSNFSCRNLAEALAVRCRVRLAPPQSLGRRIGGASPTLQNVVALQTEYNLFDRTIENHLLPYCRRTGIAVIAYSPLDQGKSLTGGRSTRVLAEIADKHGRTVSQVILNWLAAVQGVLPIPKASNPLHLRQNAAALDLSLDADDLTAIDEAFTPEPSTIPACRVRADKKGMETFVPAPEDLAREIAAGEVIKPIRVVPSAQDPNEFDLVEGKLRYWAWVKAFGVQEMVPALIRERV